MRSMPSIVSQSLMCMPAVTRSCASTQNACSRSSSPGRRTTTRSSDECSPMYSMPSENWSEKKYGSRS